ncbi:MAG: xanthine dehydrogenase molybdopterin binding subunit, partial [Variovorax sp.]|nr:xanthine dehydrogenase molybdopterin binding subunit [Variovorax sp.]
MQKPKTSVRSEPARTGLPAAGQSKFHESASAQVAGAATYIDDIPEVRGTLHAAPVCSPMAHGILRKLDASAALALPGVRAVIDAGDIPGDPTLAAFAHDEPVFALDTVQFTGQVIALVVADDEMTARRAARLVKLEIEPLPAVLNVHEAHA